MASAADKAAKAAQQRADAEKLAATQRTEELKRQNDLATEKTQKAAADAAAKAARGE